MPSTLAYVVGKMYLCTVEIQESVHGSLVAPLCTIKKIKSSPICLQLGLVLFQPSEQILAGSLLAGKYLFDYHVWIAICSS